MAGTIANVRLSLSSFNLDGAALEARHAKPYDAWERGAISADEYLDAAVFYEPRSFSREDFFAAICAQSVAACRMARWES